MPRLLCFGDSNTYGFAPGGGRYAAELRWTGRLARLLGPDWRVIEAGLNGRCAGSCDELRPELSGADTIGRYLDKYQPLDGIIVMLGTNDALGGQAAEIAASMSRLLDQALAHPATIRRHTAVLLIAPVPRRCTLPPGPVSRALAPLYQRLAAEKDIAFADAGAWEIGLTEDGCHFSPAGHRAFAEQTLGTLSGMPRLFPGTGAG